MSERVHVTIRLRAVKKKNLLLKPFRTWIQCGHKNKPRRTRISWTKRTEKMSASTTASCRFAHYFVLCGLDNDTGLEPDALAGNTSSTRFILHTQGVYFPSMTARS
ncbi:DENN domain-containing protein 5B isoform X4 [Tachysurus ichikawai]